MPRPSLMLAAPPPARLTWAVAVVLGLANAERSCNLATCVSAGLFTPIEAALVLLACLLAPLQLWRLWIFLPRWLSLRVLLVGA